MNTYGFSKIATLCDAQALPNATTGSSTAALIGGASGQYEIKVFANTDITLATDKYLTMLIRVSTDNSTWVNPYNTQSHNLMFSHTTADDAASFTAGDLMAEFRFPQATYSSYSYVEIKFACDLDLSAYKVDALLTAF